MSITDMKRFIAQHIDEVQDQAKLEQIVHIIEDEQKSRGISAAEIWAEIKTKHDGLMKRLAQ